MMKRVWSRDSQRVASRSVRTLADVSARKAREVRPRDMSFVAVQGRTLQCKARTRNARSLASSQVIGGCDDARVAFAFPMGARAGPFENDSERYRRAAGLRGDTSGAIESEWESWLLTRTARSGLAL
jgi:hypothetical protein